MDVPIVWSLIVIAVAVVNLVLWPQMLRRNPRTAPRGGKLLVALSIVIAVVIVGFVVRLLIAG